MNLKSGTKVKIVGPDPSHKGGLDGYYFTSGMREFIGKEATIRCRSRGDSYHLDLNNTDGLGAFSSYWGWHKSWFKVISMKKVKLKDLDL